MKLFPYLAVAFLIAGCGDAKTGSHIGNPVSIGFTISSALTSSTAQPQILDSTGRTYTLESVRAYVDEVRLKAPSVPTCDDISGDQLVGATCEIDTSGGIEIRVRDGHVVDLLGGEPVPFVNVPDVTYTRISYRISAAPVGSPGLGTDDPLLENGFIIGTRIDGDANERVEVRLDFEDEWRIESAALMPSTQILVHFNATDWFVNTAIENCVESTVGPIVIDSNSDCGESPGEIEKNIRENILESGELRDDD